MKRRITKLVVFLLLGAVVNVAVAWGSATWIVPLKNDLAAWQRQVGTPSLRSDYRRWWATHAPSGFQKEPVVAVRPDHLEAYVDEQAFRYSWRKESDWTRFDRLMHRVLGERLPYSRLTGGKKR